MNYTLNVSGTEIGSTPALTPTATPTPTPQTPAVTPAPAPAPAIVTPAPTPVPTVTPAPTPVPTVTPAPAPAPVPIADGNETAQTALGLTLSETTKTYTIQDLTGLPSGAEPFSISDTDREDYYSFSLDSRAKVDLTIGGLTGDIDVQLLGVNIGNDNIPTSDNVGTISESISETLDAGEYFLRVYQPLAGEETNYTITGSAILRDDNDTPDNAYLLLENPGDAEHGQDSLSFRSTIFDNNYAAFVDNPFSIDANDSVDYFKFRIARDSEIRFTLTDLAGDLNLSILNAEDPYETVLAPQNPGVGLADEMITPAEGFSTDLAAGSYLLKVEAASEGVVSENYTLDLAAIPEQTDDFETGDTPAEARTFPEYALGELGNTSFSNSVRFGDDESLWVGGEDPEDYYKIELTEQSYISIDLVDVVNESINQDSNLDVQLLRQTSEDPLEVETVVTSARPGDLSEVVGGQLDAGTYYIRVYPNDPAVDGSFYQMDLALFSLNDIPALTRDIAIGDEDGVTAGEMVSIGTDVYFVANEVTQNEDGSLNRADPAIWISSGASTNDAEITTEKVIFQNPQEFDAITNLSVVNGQLYFLGTVGSTQALWTQGESGLEQLTGANGDNASASELSFTLNTNPNFTVVGDTLYFFAGTVNESNNHRSGSELWAVKGSDVTLETNVIADYAGGPVIDFDPFFSNLDNLTVIDDILYFTKSGASTGLYRYDPSANDIDTAAILLDSSGFSENLTAVGDTLYFTVDETLKRIQKDQTTSADIEDINTSETITEFGDGTFISVTAPDNSKTLYFTARSRIDNILQTELWYVNQNDNMDPSDDIAERITDLAGTRSPQPEELTVIGDNLLFAAQDADGDRELWSLNINPDALGNQFHTPSLVKDINAVTPDGATRTNSSSLENFIAVDGVLYFAADNGINGKELWKSDGTEEGTTLVSDIQLPVVDGFETVIDEETGLPVIDEDTGLEKTIPITVNGSSNPGDFINVGDRLFFTADGTLADASAVDGRQKLGRELWALGLKADEPS